MQSQIERGEEEKRLGELIALENGKLAGIRVLPDGKVEQSYQGAGKLLGMDSVSVYTAVGTPQAGGVMNFEANGIVTTVEGDVMTVKIWGINYPRVQGYKYNVGRGGAITQTSSQKLQRLNNATNVWEVQADEAGNYRLRVWEWK